jgi:septum formation protein
MITQNPLLVLASNSPRRQHLLTELGFDYTVQVEHTDEYIPTGMPLEDVPQYLAIKKAEAVLHVNQMPCVVLAADTVVIVDDQILNKPNDATEAFQMLRKLSGRKHTVITGVAVLSKDKNITFQDETDVYFGTLSDENMQYYINEYQPFDKAGAYGAQDWLGMVAIERIEGSYFNVMGLPVHKVFATLKDFGF